MENIWNYTQANLWIMSLVATILSLVIALYFRFRKSKQNETQHNIGINDDCLTLIIEPYQEKIKELDEQLSKSTTPDEEYRLRNDLNKAKIILSEKIGEIGELDKLIENSSYKVVKEATEILNNNGITEALEFLKSKEIQAKEHHLNEDMKEAGEKYKLEATLHKLQNEYDQATQAYEKMLQYDRSADNLFDFAHYLHESRNDISNATKYYKEALAAYKKLADTNYTIYNLDVIATLNSIANLYMDEKRFDKAIGACQEALSVYIKINKHEQAIFKPNIATTLNNLAILYGDDKSQHEVAIKYQTQALGIYRDLAKANPAVYNTDYANTLIMGVDILGQDIGGLAEARKLLEPFRGVHRADRLLELIDELSKD